jgi:hypothetical protein
MLLFAAIALFAATNVTGTWTGDATDNEGGRQGAYLLLQQDGLKVTGVAGASKEHAWPVKRAVCRGDRLTFGVTSSNSETGEQIEWLFDLKVESDHMAGTAEARRGDQSFEIKVELTRQK